MRNISFLLTTNQFLDGTKDVTRRDGWREIKPGDIMRAVEKSRGLKKGDTVKSLGTIRVKSVRRERLSRMTDDPTYGAEECRREGFPGLSPADFVEMFRKSHEGVVSSSTITRIEFERISDG